MHAIFAKARFDLRTRLRSLIALALILGVGGGAVMAVLAGADRTDSVFEGFQQRYRDSNIMLALGSDAPLRRADIAALPGVREALVENSLPGQVRGEFTRLYVPADRSSFSRFKVVAGRLPEHGSVDEVGVSPLAARRLGLRPGGVVRWNASEAVLSVVRRSGASMPSEFTFRVVGIVVSSFLGGSGGSGNLLLGTPALNRTLPGSPPLSYYVQVYLERGAAGLPAFRADLKRLAGGKTVDEFPREEFIRQAQRSFHFQATALRLLGLLGGLALALVVSQTLSRHVRLLSTDGATLSALGMTGRQLRAAVILVLGITGAAAGIMAGVLAFALSPLAPLGDARLVEINPGPVFDAGVLGFGALVILAVTVVLSLPAAWRTIRVARRGRESRIEHRPARIVDALQRIGMSAPVVVGARLAFDRRAGTPVPARTTITEIALGVAALATALTVSGSISNFVSKPALVGKFWDIKFGADTDPRPFERQILEQPGVTGLAFGGGGPRFMVNGRRVGGMQISPPVSGAVGLPILEGRAPRALDEVALGTETIRRLRVRIGDRVLVARRAEDRAVGMTVVGRAVFEPFSATLGLGHGMLVTYESGRTLDPQSRIPQAYVRLDADVTSVDVFLAGLRRAAPALRPYAGVFNTPSEVLTFGNVSHLPLVLAGILGVFALATLLHALVSVIRARSRDFAILKALGFDRRQVARAVAWQAGLIVYIALLFGVPVGVVAGRALWLAIANSIGIVPQVHLAALPLVAIVPAALLAARLIAAIPGRVAARTSPALVLRAE